LLVLIFKSAPRWVFIKIVFGLDQIHDFWNFYRDFVWKIRSITVWRLILLFFYGTLIFAILWIFHTKSRTKFRKSRIISKPKTIFMKTQRRALLNTKEKTNPSQKFWTFIKNRKVRQLFRFSYKTAKNLKLRNALTSLNTWIWRLKFGLRAQNKSYYILFIFIFWYERKSLERDQPSPYSVK
jgi:hypothetical protein